MDKRPRKVLKRLLEAYADEFYSSRDGMHLNQDHILADVAHVIARDVVKRERKRRRNVGKYGSPAPVLDEKYPLETLLAHSNSRATPGALQRMVELMREGDFYS